LTADYYKMPKGTKNNITMDLHMNTVCGCGRVFLGKTIRECENKARIHGTRCEKYTKNTTIDTVEHTTLFYNNDGKLTGDYYKKIDKISRKRLGLDKTKVEI